MCASVISRSDPPPVLELGEHVFDLVTLLVENSIVFNLSLSVFLRWDARLDTLFFQGGPEPIRVVAAIRQEASG